jgi:hypothetical protein
VDVKRLQRRLHCGLRDVAAAALHHFAASLAAASVAFHAQEQQALVRAEDVLLEGAALKVQAALLVAVGHPGRVVAHHRAVGAPALARGKEERLLLAAIHHLLDFGVVQLADGLKDGLALEPPAVALLEHHARLSLHHHKHPRDALVVVAAAEPRGRPSGARR